MAWVEQRNAQFRVRFRQSDGTVATDSVHETKTAARKRATEIDVDQRRNVFYDPQAGSMPLREWVKLWMEAHDVSDTTWARYRSHLDVHILPKFGDMPLASISRMAIKGWVKDLNRRRAWATVDSIINLLSMILNEAVEEHKIPVNPCRRVRTGSHDEPERPWASPAQVTTIAQRNTAPDRLLIIAAAYTGMRWGELVGLRRPNCRLDEGRIYVDPETGNLHEVAGRLELGPPKTPASVRNVLLPPFLIELLRGHLTTHVHAHVFVGRDGGLHRRSNFNRRAWRPAVDGNQRKSIRPVVAGMHFHDLRHSHKTWMIEADVPEVAQAKRLGHKLPGVRGIYSHVSPTVEQRLVNELQKRWEATKPDTAPADNEGDHTCD